MAGLSINIAEKMASESKKLFRSEYGDIPIDIEVVNEPNHKFIGVGTGIILIAERYDFKINSKYNINMYRFLFMLNKVLPDVYLLDLL